MPNSSLVVRTQRIQGRPTDGVARVPFVVALAFVASTALGVGGAAAVAGAGDGAAPTTVPAVSTTPTSTSTTAATTSSTTSSTSTSTSTTTTTVAPPVAAPAAPAPVAAPEPEPEPEPAPIAPPADPYENVDVVGIGRIKIPAIGLDHEIYEGISLTVIDVGPGHWPGTPRPGGAGNVVFGGHRVTHSHPFRDVDLLKPGDQILFEMYDGTSATYVMTEQFVVYPDAMWIVDPTPDNIVTIFACHPKGSAQQRIVTRAQLQG